MNKLAGLIVATWTLVAAGYQLSAQTDASPGPDAPLRNSDELNQLLGPIALYPDPLIAELLPAATLPTQIVMADRYVSEGGDPNLISQQPWDASVQALAHYPTVLKWMDDNLAWTTQLGEAFENQQSDVMNAIQSLRVQAQELGNLQSTPQETVTSDNGDIDIDPTDPDQLYVPSYQPDEIYSQPGYFCSFGIGLPIGLWLGHDWDWHGHRLITWGPGHMRPSGFWHEGPGQRHNAIVSNHVGVWHPPRGGSGVIIRGGEGADRGYERSVITHAAATPRPFERAPEVSRAPDVGRAPNIGRAPEERRAPEPIRAPAVRSAPEPMRAPVFRSESEGVFGGSQSSSEVRASSSRGESSRAEMGGGGRSGGSSNRR
jgi:hypothetical protein